MRTLLLALPFLAGCTNYQQVKGPDPTRKAYLIRAAPSATHELYNTAGQLCPKGYSMSGRDSPGCFARDEVLVECKPAP